MPPTAKSVVVTDDGAIAASKVTVKARLVVRWVPVGPVRVTTPGAVRSTVSVVVARGAVGPGALSESITVLAPSVGMTVPSDPDVPSSATEYDAPDPLRPETVHPEAVPSTVTSPGTSPVTDVLKTRLKVALVPFVAVTDGANVVTTGTTAIACETPATRPTTSTSSTAARRRGLEEDPGYGWRRRVQVIRCQDYWPRRSESG